MDYSKVNPFFTIPFPPEMTMTDAMGDIARNLQQLYVR